MLQALKESESNHNLLKLSFGGICMWKETFLPFSKIITRLIFSISVFIAHLFIIHKLKEWAETQSKLRKEWPQKNKDLKVPTGTARKGWVTMPYFHLSFNFRTGTLKMSHCLWNTFTSSVTGCFIKNVMQFQYLSKGNKQMP